jgi:multidrug efflux pump subunit AcrB
MWIVRLALRRPYTFVVVSLLIAILGVAAIITMPVDIFPYIDIPVVSIVWNYNGLSPEEMEKRMVASFERSMTTTVNDIEHIESQAYTGVSVTRVYFQPNAKVELALAQITALSQTLLRPMPPGTLPPSIIKYDASSVPILQLGLQSETMSEQELFDMGQNFIRTQLAIIQGAAVPLPYGGKFRQVMIDLNPDQLTSKGLSASDVSSAMGNQNLIFPAGTVKIGDKDYQVRTTPAPRHGRAEPHAVARGKRRAVISRTWPRSATDIPSKPAWCARTAAAAPSSLSCATVRHPHLQSSTT